MHRWSSDFIIISRIFGDEKQNQKKMRGIGNAKKTRTI